MKIWTIILLRYPQIQAWNGEVFEGLANKYNYRLQAHAAARLRALPKEAQTNAAALHIASLRSW